MTNADQDFVAAYLGQSVAATASFAADPAYVAVLEAMAGAIVAAIRSGAKLMVCGNGGSAGDAQHIAGEFIARLMYDRAPLPAIALTTDSSVLTATANDYGYDFVFERQVRGLGRPGDVLLGISTSGRSPNVLRALEAARAGGLIALGFTGEDGGPMQECTNYLLEAPARATAVVQQIHILASHILCALVERAMFPPPGALL